MSFEVMVPSDQDGKKEEILVQPPEAVYANDMFKRVIVVRARKGTYCGVHFLPITKDMAAIVEGTFVAEAKFESKEGWAYAVFPPFTVRYPDIYRLMFTFFDYGPDQAPNYLAKPIISRDCRVKYGLECLQNDYTDSERSLIEDLEKLDEFKAEFL